MAGNEVQKSDVLGRIEHSKKIDEAIAKCGAKTVAGLPVLQRGLRIAEGIKFLRNLLDDDMMAGIMQLMDNPLGFMTDRNGVDKSGRPKTPYSIDVVRNATIEGLLRGVFPVDNQMNIIAGRCYVAKSGFRHLVKEIDGLTELDVNMRVPRTSDGEVVVEAWATWKIDGKPWKIEPYEISVKVYPGQGSDLALGKADRRLHKRIYEKITGSYVPDGEVDLESSDQGGVIDIEKSPVSDIQDRMAKARETAPKPPKTKPPKTEPAPKQTEEPEKAANASGIPQDVWDQIDSDERALANSVWGQAIAAGWDASDFLSRHEFFVETGQSPEEALATMKTKFDEAK